MLEVSAAREIVLRSAKPLPAAPVALSPAALGAVLGEDVASDVDSPPFRKALMDGYAVRLADLAGGAVELRVIEEVAAGAVPVKAVGPGEAVAIYTGAPMPAGADVVVMKERCEVLPGGVVRATDPSLKAGKNVMPQGAEMRTGDVAVPAGTILTPVALGLLAAVGRTESLVIRQPKVAVLVTGDELVNANETPAGGQIRNTNGPMLEALAVRAGADTRSLGIGRDDEAALKALVAEGLATADVLLLSGGVSAGKFDLVPGVLKALGVEVHFHHVRMKPGKPLLFGTKGDVLVFGLPGNPVSGYVGFELFVRPALRTLAGHRDPAPREGRFELAEDLDEKHDRPTFHPARVHSPSGFVHPLPWLGSADLRGLLTANALIPLPPGEVKWSAGKLVNVILSHE